MNVIHYDLFAGIGGFSYALDTIFNEHEINHIFCEWEAFPTAVLKKHWPDATYYGDITDLVADTRCERRCARTGKELRPTQLQSKLPYLSNDCGISFLTGGFPCQPFSHAGRRRGTADHRYQWPNMFDVIRNVRPDWVIAENVRGLATWNEGLVLETVCADLENEGYEVQPLIVPAVAVDAPHRRDRVWIVAHAPNFDDRRNAGKFPQADEPQTPQRPQERSAKPSGASDSLWQRDWHEVAFATCHDGMDDGLPRWMDGIAISSARHRRERLKTCGNAIVPQVAMEIFSAIRTAVDEFKG